MSGGSQAKPKKRPKGTSLEIRRGNPSVLKRSDGWRKAKVWKKTNQWFYCPVCMALFYFRVFKCRFDFGHPIPCECGLPLTKAPDSICGDAKKLFPHFKERKHGDGFGGIWYFDVYLKSDLWKAIRSRVLERDNRTCQRCHNAANIVHHKSYHVDVIEGRDDSKLISLCFTCHLFIEFDGDRKLSLREANERLGA